MFKAFPPGPVPRIEYIFLKGEEATRGRVSDLLQKHYFDIIHVATHAKFEPTDPAESGVVLNDGLLRTRDIYDSDVYNTSKATIS